MSVAGEVTLRRARPGDAALLRYWDGKPHVITATGADAEARDDWAEELAREADWGEWLIAECDGRAIGALQVIDPAREATHYWGGIEADLRALDIWIGEEADLGRGYGSQMMRQVLDRCFAAPEVKAVLLDPLESNRRAHRFYERFGFRDLGRRRFGEDDCLVYRLERAEWERRNAGG